MRHTPTFNNSKNEFLHVLRGRVNFYFTSNGISKTANGSMVFKTVFHSALWLSSYLLIVFGDYSISTNYIFWLLLGLAMAFTAVNIGHDAIHGAYSSKKWVNQMLSLFFDINGASSYMWKSMHNIAHHTYTNVHEYDGDLEILPILRLSPKHKLRWVNKFQHIYAFFFYGLATISWMFFKDYAKFFQNKIGNYSNQKHKPSAILVLISYKLISYGIFLTPFFTTYSDNLKEFIFSFLLMHFTSGITLALIFALAHLVEKTHFPEPNHEGTIENSWAVHQLYTTANFSVKSKLTHFITGGLNTQIEHHLFPNVCSIHYRHIAPIVKKTAKDFNLPYYEYPSFYMALKSHINFLKLMGNSPKASVKPTMHNNG